VTSQPGTTDTGLPDRGLETLQIWQRSLEFARLVCSEVLPQLPEQEKWSLTSQLRRSVQSIPANIAEGYGRYYYQENVRFCYIARGSLEETYSHLSLAFQLHYLSRSQYNPLEAELREIRKMLSGYISFLKKSKRGGSEPGAGISLHEDMLPYMIEPEDSKPDPLDPDPNNHHLF
jgi:four helix bundle protein